MHNMIVEALKRLRDRDKNGWDMISKVYELERDVVLTNHHRQFPDLLAILLLIQREIRGESEGGGPLPGHSDEQVAVTTSREIQSSLIKDMIEWARQDLQPEDLRQHMFELLKGLTPQDHAGHLSGAFDEYCRHLWFSLAEKKPDDPKET